MFANKRVTITTKERGNIVGIPQYVDELETDEKRMGYVIEVSPHYVEIVYFDEITAIF